MQIIVDKPLNSINSSNNNCNSYDSSNGDENKKDIFIQPRDDNKKHHLNNIVNTINNDSINSNHINIDINQEAKKGKFRNFFETFLSEDDPFIKAGSLNPSQYHKPFSSNLQRNEKNKDCNFNSENNSLISDSNNFSNDLNVPDIRQEMQENYNKALGKNYMSFLSSVNPNNKRSKLNFNLIANPPGIVAYKQTKSKNKSLNNKNKDNKTNNAAIPYTELIFQDFKLQEQYKSIDEEFLANATYQPNHDKLNNSDNSNHNDINRTIRFTYPDIPEEEKMQISDKKLSNKGKQTADQIISAKNTSKLDFDPSYSQVAEKSCFARANAYINFKGFNDEFNNFNYPNNNNNINNNIQNNFYNILNLHASLNNNNNNNNIDSNLYNNFHNNNNKYDSMNINNASIKSILLSEEKAFEAYKKFNSLTFLEICEKMKYYYNNNQKIILDNNLSGSGRASEINNIDNNYNLSKNNNNNNNNNKTLNQNNPCMNNYSNARIAANLSMDKINNFNANNLSELKGFLNLFQENYANCKLKTNADSIFKGIKAMEKKFDFYNSSNYSCIKNSLANKKTINLEIIKSNVSLNIINTKFVITKDGLISSQRSKDNSYISIGRQQINDDGIRPNDIMLFPTDPSISRSHFKIWYKNFFQEENSFFEKLEIFLYMLERNRVLPMQNTSCSTKAFLPSFIANNNNNNNDRNTHNIDNMGYIGFMHSCNHNSNNYNNFLSDFFANCKRPHSNSSYYMPEYLQRINANHIFDIFKYLIPAEQVAIEDNSTIFGTYVRVKAFSLENILNNIYLQYQTLNVYNSVNNINFENSLHTLLTNDKYYKKPAADIFKRISLEKQAIKTDGNKLVKNNISSNIPMLLLNNTNNKHAISIKQLNTNNLNINSQNSSKEEEQVSPIYIQDCTAENHLFYNYENYSPLKKMLKKCLEKDNSNKPEQAHNDQYNSNPIPNTIKNDNIGNYINITNNNNLTKIDLKENPSLTVYNALPYRSNSSLITLCNQTINNINLIDKAKKEDGEFICQEIELENYFNINNSKEANNNNNTINRPLSGIAGKQLQKNKTNTISGIELNDKGNNYLNKSKETEIIQLFEEFNNLNLQKKEKNNNRRNLPGATEKPEKEKFLSINSFKEANVNSEKNEFLETLLANYPLRCSSANSKLKNSQIQSLYWIYLNKKKIDFLLKNFPNEPFNPYSENFYLDFYDASSSLNNSQLNYFEFPHILNKESNTSNSNPVVELLKGLNRIPSEINLKQADLSSLLKISHYSNLATKKKQKSPVNNNNNNNYQLQKIFSEFNFNKEHYASKSLIDSYSDLDFKKNLAFFKAHINNAFFEPSGTSSEEKGNYININSNVKTSYGKRAVDPALQANDNGVYNPSELFDIFNNNNLILKSGSVFLNSNKSGFIVSKIGTFEEVKRAVEDELKEFLHNENSHFSKIEIISQDKVFDFQILDVNSREYKGVMTKSSFFHFFMECKMETQSWLEDYCMLYLIETSGDPCGIMNRNQEYILVASKKKKIKNSKLFAFNYRPGFLLGNEIFCSVMNRDWEAHAFVSYDPYFDKWIISDVTNFTKPNIYYAKDYHGLWICISPDKKSSNRYNCCQYYVKSGDEIKVSETVMKVLFHNDY